MFIEQLLVIDLAQPRWPRLGFGTPRLRQIREHCRAFAGGLSVMGGPTVCDDKGRYQFAEGGASGGFDIDNSTRDLNSDFARSTQILSGSSAAPSKRCTTSSNASLASSSRLSPLKALPLPTRAIAT